MRYSTIITATALPILSTNAAATCYKKDGVPDSTLVACDPSASNSVCCQVGDICNSNGLCQPVSDTVVTNNVYRVDGCTDPTYQAPECATVNNCRNFAFDLIKTCTGTDKYCCAGAVPGNCMCKNTTYQEFFTFANAGATIVPYTTISPSSTTAAVSSSATITTTTETTATTSSTSSTQTSSAATSSSAAAASSSPTPSTSPSPSSSSSTIGIGVGVGVAVPLAIAGIILFFLIRRRKSAKARAAYDLAPRHEHELDSQNYPAEPKTLIDDPASPPAELAGDREVMQLDSKPGFRAGGAAELG